MKRILDVVVAGLFLVATLPLQLLVALCILVDDGRPVLYRQRRIGRAGQPFELTKFRSMVVNDIPPGAMGEIRAGHPLLTRTGKVIRRLKLDELPQLVLVLRGQMSLVGPRPTLPNQVERYDDYQRQRLRMRPGLTGWAQVHGGIELSWADRIVLDVWYVERWSLWVDLTILAKTARVLLLGERPNGVALKAVFDHKANS